MLYLITFFQRVGTQSLLLKGKHAAENSNLATSDIVGQLKIQWPQVKKYDSTSPKLKTGLQLTMPCVHVLCI